MISGSSFPCGMRVWVTGIGSTVYVKRLEVRDLKPSALQRQLETRNLKPSALKSKEITQRSCSLDCCEALLSSLGAYLRSRSLPGANKEMCACKASSINLSAYVFVYVPTCRHTYGHLHFRGTYMYVYIYTHIQGPNCPRQLGKIVEPQNRSHDPTG